MKILYLRKEDRKKYPFRTWVSLNVLTLVFVMVLFAVLPNKEHIVVLRWILIVPVVTTVQIPRPFFGDATEKLYKKYCIVPFCIGAILFVLISFVRYFLEIDITSPFFLALFTGFVIIFFVVQLGFTIVGFKHMIEKIRNKNT